MTPSAPKAPTLDELKARSVACVGASQEFLDSKGVPITWVADVAAHSTLSMVEVIKRVSDQLIVGVSGADAMAEIEKGLQASRPPGPK